MAREINTSTDNPLFFENEHGELESLSGGNFHGALLSYSMDLLGIVVTDLGVLSERRSARLLDPNMSYGLPYNLVVDGIGLNTGFALVQANATALVGEMRTLANPSEPRSLAVSSSSLSTPSNIFSYASSQMRPFSLLNSSTRSLVFLIRSAAASTSGVSSAS